MTSSGNSSNRLFLNTGQSLHFHVCRLTRVRVDGANYYDCIFLVAKNIPRIEHLLIYLSQVSICVYKGGEANIGR